MDTTYHCGEVPPYSIRGAASFVEMMILTIQGDEALKRRVLWFKSVSYIQPDSSRITLSRPSEKVLDK